MATSCKWLTVPQGPFSGILQFLELEERLAVHDTSKSWRGRAVYFFNLQKEIPKYTRMDQLTLVRIASLCPNLTTVSIRSRILKTLSDRSLSVLLLKCKHLSSLAFEQGFYLCAERTLAAFTARSVLPQYTPLTSLELSDFYHYQDEELAQIVASCTQLQQLTFFNCSNLSDKTIEALIIHCPSLQKLHIQADHAIPIYPDRATPRGGCHLTDKEAEILQKRFKKGCQVTVWDGRIGHPVKRRRPVKNDA